MSREVTTCPVCKSNEFGLEFTVTREDKYAISLAGEPCPPARYRECSYCRAMVWVNPINFDHMYESGEYYAVDGDPADFLAQRYEQIINLPPESSDNVQRVRRINAFLEEAGLRRNGAAPGQVLDVGAGMGVFFHAFLDDGWEGTAIEPEPNAQAHLADVLPDVGVYPRIGDGHFEGKFDLITMNRVLEHIADPLPAVDELVPLLALKGVLYLELPDVESYYQAGPDDEAFGYEHYVVYSPESLAVLLSEVGLSAIETRRLVEPSGKFTIYVIASCSPDEEPIRE